MVLETCPFLEARFATLELMMDLWLPTNVMKGTHYLAMFSVCAIVVALGMGMCQNVCLVRFTTGNYYLVLPEYLEPSGCIVEHCE